MTHTLTQRATRLMPCRARPANRLPAAQSPLRIENRD
jgi:hypothetical protein